MHFQRAFTACDCIFKVITLVVSSQSNYFKNATTCSKSTPRTRVATQLKKPGRIYNNSVKLGYNELGYNEHSAITNNFFSPKGHFTT
jgi:hypothetical protein